MDRRYGGGVLVLAISALTVIAAYVRLGDHDRRPITVEAAHIERVTGSMIEPPTAFERTTVPYRGYGTWIDVFDFSPPYAGPNPTVTTDDLDEMAADGIRTIFLQSARLDDRSPLGLEDPWLLADFLHGAHSRGIAVVAWYLPKWSADGGDLERLVLLDQYEVLGQRFDGVAVDIEWTGGDIDPDDRNRRLVSLSAEAASKVDGPLGAIVLPPVLTEVVNEDLWPSFPWTEIASSYDVWLPMSYWSFRSDSSGYGDGYAYNAESTRRLRENIGDASALVHGVGGIGGVDGSGDTPDPAEPLTTMVEIEAFVRSLVDTGSIGGSMYDWNTLEPGVRRGLATLFESGAAADLGLS